MTLSITLKDSTTLASAYLAESYPGGQRFNVPVYDDSWGELWLFGHEYGVARVIRCRTFDEAWEIAIDESPAIEQDDVPEAYDYRSQPALDAAVEIAEHNGDYPELIEGYEYQSNASGTGIVNVGHYAWLREAQASDFQGENRLRIVVTAD